MKQYFKILTIITAVAIVAISCNKEDAVITEEANLTVETSTVERGYWFPWDYVMDWRYSRAECATGPGVCFRNGYGDIFRIYTNGDGYVNEVTDTMNRLMADNRDPDNGLIVFSLEDSVLHLVFSRELEEGNFIVDENQQLGQPLVERLGREEIVIPAGEYEVSYENFEFGETFINIE